MTTSVLERIWAKVVKGEPDACWMWTGGTGQKGGPMISVNKRSLSPRRFLWEEAHGGDPLPPTRLVSTSCREPRCLNPAHLVLRPFNDDVARFWSLVRKADGDACWEWQGYIFTNKEYGGIKVKGRMLLAHRYAWELTHGPIVGHVPGDAERELCVLHRCDNPRCVRPDHLFLGTDADNMADCDAKGRRSRGPEHGEKVRQAKANMKRIVTDLMRRHAGDRGPDTKQRTLATLATPTGGTE